LAHLDPGLINAPSEDHAVGTRKVDVLEDTVMMRRRREGGEGAYAFFVDEHDLAGFDLADVASIDEIEGASFRGENRTAIELSEDQRTKSPWITNAKKGVGGQGEQSKSALERCEGIEQSVGDVSLLRAGEKMKDDFRVTRRAENRAAVNELLPQDVSVDQVTVVANCYLAVPAVDVDGLDVGGGAFARCRVPDVSYGSFSFQFLEDLGAEHVSDIPLGFSALKSARGGCDHPGTFLPTVLKGVKAQVAEACGVGVAIDSENTALFSEPVFEKCWAFSIELHS
jgi:hypothetical protein